MADPFTAATRRFIATVAATAAALALMTAAALPVRAAGPVPLSLAVQAPVSAPVTLVDHRHRQPQFGHQYGPQFGHDIPRGSRHDRHDRRRAQVLPANCAVEVVGHRRNGIAYPEGCLRRNGIEHRLPQYCALSVRLRGRVVTAYPQRCLLDAGFVVAGRSRY